MAAKTHPPDAALGHPLFNFVGKRGLNVGYLNTHHIYPINPFQAPLSGEAEERVAGAASPGEY